MATTLTDAELTTLVRETAATVETSGHVRAEKLAAMLKARGVKRGVHVGKKDMTPREILEWYIGQFLDIVETESWISMNSWLNCVDKFAPELPAPAAAVS